jgi:hypothetical protein
MEYRVRLNLATAALVVALGVGVSVVTSTVVAARAYAQRGAQAVAVGRDITVKGSTRKRVVSDRAVWNIRVRGDGTELKTAFEVLEAGVVRVRAFLAERGFDDGHVGVGAIDTDMSYARDEKGNVTSQVVGYTLSRIFQVTTADVERVARAAGEVTALIREGVLVMSMAPEFYFAKLPELRIELMGLAAKDARARADEIAANAGCRVGEVRSASMGVLQVTQPNSTEVSGYGVYDTGTIEKDVTAVVTLVLGVERAE